MKKRLFAWLIAICMVLSLLPCTALADEPLAALDLKYAVYSVGSDAWTPLSDGSNRYQYTAGTVAAGATGTWAWYYNSNGTYTLELNNFQTGETLLDYGVRLPAVTAEVRITGDVSIAAEDNAIDTTENYGCTQTIIGTGENPKLTLSIQSEVCAALYTEGTLVIENLIVDVSASAKNDSAAIVAYGPITLNNCNITMKGASQGLAGMGGGVTIYNSQLEIRDTAVGIASFGELSVQNSQIDMDLRVDEDNVLEIGGKEVAIGFICNGAAELTGAETQVRVDYTKPEDMPDCYHAVFIDEATLQAVLGDGYTFGTKSITGGTYNWDVSGLVQSPPYGAVENESRPWGEAVDTWTVVRPYNITSAMSHATLNGPATIYSGREYTATLEPAEGHQLPDNIIVWVGAVATGSRLDTDEYAYDNTTGKITIFANANFENDLFITGAYHFNANTRTIGGNIWNPDITATVTFSGGDTMLLSGNSGWSSSIYYAGQTATLSHTNNETNLRFLGWYDTLESRQIRFGNSIEENVPHAVPESDVRIDAVYLYATAKEVAGLFGTNPDSDGAMDPTFGPYSNDNVTVSLNWDEENEQYIWEVTLKRDITDINLQDRPYGESLKLTIDLNDYTISGSNGTSENPDGKTALTLGNGYDLTITGPGEIVGGSGADSTTGAGGKGGNGIDDGIDNGELTLRNGVIVRGGQGGDGAPGQNGGSGGTGITTLNDSVELVAMDAYIYGGAGGKGGDAETGNAGSGGSGGAGAAGTGSAYIAFFGGAISGGSGGAGGNAANGNGGSGGQGGAGVSGEFKDLLFVDGKLYDELLVAMDAADECLGCTGPAAVTGGDGGKGGDAANGNGGSGGAGGAGISANFPDSASDGLINLGAITGGGGGDGGSAVTDTIRVDLVGQGGSGGTAVSGTGHQYTLEEIFGGVQPPVEITTGTSVPGETGKNGTVRLTADIPGPVIIPDNLGEVTIDLNGHDIYGQSGTSGNPDGGDAIIMTHENGGTGTTLTIIDTSNGEKGVVRGGDGYPGSGGSGGNGITVNPEAENPEINIGAGVTVIGGNGANSTTGDGGNGGSGVDGDVNNNNGAITGGNGGSGKTEGGDGGSGVTGNVNNNGGAITDGNGGNSDNGAGGSGGNGDSNDNGNNGGNGGGSGATTYYTLRFAANGGSDVAPIRKVSGSTITLNQTSARDGYCFTGWYLDEACTEKVTSVKLTKDLTVYAGWQKDTVDPNVSGVSKWLITGDHVKYLNGYPNGLFGPDDDMTRAEVSQMLYNLLLDKDVSITKTFPDVPDTLWCAKAVNTLASLGVIYGYPDGSFGPNDKITREQFCAIVTRFANKIEAGDMEYTEFFSDVSSRSWSYDSVMTAVSLGWIHGYGNGLFGPTDNITRAQAVTIVNRMLGRSADQNFVNTSTDIKTFSDLSKSHWAYYAIMEATNTHDYKRNGTYETWDDLQ